jgi:20S proteasome alpha/beta subunit
MTCIAAWIHPDKQTITMGADSRVTDNGVIHATTDSKIFEYDNLIIGVSGELSALQKVKYNMELVDFATYTNRINYDSSIQLGNPSPSMSYVLAIANKLKSMLSLPEEVNPLQVKDIPYINILIGIDGKLYTIEFDFSVICHMERYAAIGSGKLSALSVMKYADNKTPNIEPEKLLTDVLEISSYLNASVGPPFVLITKNTKNDT